MTVDWSGKESYWNDDIWNGFSDGAVSHLCMLMI